MLHPFILKVTSVNIHSRKKLVKTRQFIPAFFYTISNLFLGLCRTRNGLAHCWHGMVVVVVWIGRFNLHAPRWFITKTIRRWKRMRLQLFLRLIRVGGIVEAPGKDQRAHSLSSTAAQLCAAVWCISGVWLVGRYSEAMNFRMRHTRPAHRENRNGARSARTCKNSERTPGTSAFIFNNRLYA